MDGTGQAGDLITPRTGRMTWRRALRWAGITLGIWASLMLVVGLSLRFWIMDDVVRFKPAIESMASQAVGMTVQIDRIEAAWSGITPRFTLREIRVRTPQNETVLQVARADADLSWWSPLLGRVHLKQLRLDGLVIEAERDAQGVIRVAGHIVNGAGNEAGVADWLLLQREIIIANSRLTWRDQMLGAPPLALVQTNMTLQNRFSKHTLVVQAQPPADAALNLELNGSFHGDTLSQLSAWNGHIDLHLTETSAKALNTWAPWAQDTVRAGMGDIHLTLDFAQARIHAVNAETQLRAVVLQLDPGLPELQLDQLSGEIGWRQQRDTQEIYATNLVFAQQGSAPSAPAKLKLNFTPGANGKGIARGRIEAEGIYLETFAALSGSIPMPHQLHDLIERHKPRGQILQARGEWQSKDRFSLNARLSNLGMEAANTLPGVNNLSGEIRMDEGSGQIRLESQDLKLTAAQHFRLPLTFDQARGELSWQRDNTATVIKMNGLQLVNQDLDGQLDGSLTLYPNRAPVADLKAHLQRGNGNAIWRYLPHEVNDDTLVWLRDSILAGHTRDARMVLRGPLDHYPFASGGGEFHITIPTHAVRLRYAPDWPEINGIEGVVRFQGRGMQITTHDGMIWGVQLPKVTARIPDLFHNQQTLLIEGEAAGPLPQFLDFIIKSPVAKAIDHATDELRGTGNAHLNLNLALPLHDMDRVRVEGRVTLDKNRIEPGRGMPTLESASGTLQFTQSGLNAQNLQISVLGQPARLNLTSQPGGALQVNLTGNARAANLKPWLPKWIHPHLKGQSDYRVGMRLLGADYSFNLDSNLVGMELNLPAPLDKSPSVPMSLAIKSRTTGKTQSTLVHLGGVVHAHLKSGAGPDRMRVWLGKINPDQDDPGMPVTPGIVVNGRLDALDFDHWRAILPVEVTSGSDSGPALTEISLNVNELMLLDRIWHKAQLKINPLSDGLSMKLDSSEAKGGHLSYKPGQIGMTPRLNARFDALTIPKAIDRPLQEAPNDSLEGQLEIGTLKLENKLLGQLKVDFKQLPAGIEVTSMQLKHDLYDLNIKEGFLAAHPRHPSHLKGVASVSDLGRLAEHFGHPGKISGGKAKLTLSEVKWTGKGVPKPANISARFDLEVNKGQFLKLDPGAARLLGIFSLQSLQRRFTLDFHDVFSDGFAFDQIHAHKLVMEQGALYLPNATMEGPAAKVEMGGVIHLGREDLRLQVRVEPRVEDSVALASGLAGGPAVAVGVYLAQKLLKDKFNPIGQITRFEYRVNGHWDDPKIEKLAVQNQRPSQPNPQPNP